jgi:hypothetical protein
MKLLSLDEMITPKILTGIYILTTILAALAAVFTLIGGSTGGAIAWAIVAIFNRIFFECIIVVFKNNEYLKKSADHLEYIATTLAKSREDEIYRATKNAAPDADFSEADKDNPPQDKQ